MADASEQDAGKMRDRLVHRRAFLWGLLLAVGLLAIAATWGNHELRLHQLRVQLLASSAEDVVKDPALVNLAVQEARPLAASRCAVCHGADLQGRQDIGAPNLTDRIWLYGTGRVFEIERTIMFGIRSGQSNARNIADMPAFGQKGQLNKTEISDVVQYLLQLNHRPRQSEAADNGAAIFYGKGNCFDCHGADAHGNPDYGAPDLTLNLWNYGGSPNALYRSVYAGRHGLCPAWLGTLSLEQIRALSVYLYKMSHP